MRLIMFLGCAFTALILILPPIWLGSALERDEPGEIGLALTFFVIIEFVALVIILYTWCKGG